MIGIMRLSPIGVKGREEPPEASWNGSPANPFVKQPGRVSSAQLARRGQRRKSHVRVVKRCARSLPLESRRGGGSVSEGGSPEKDTPC